MSWVERRGRLDCLTVGVLSRSSSGSIIGRDWVCCLVKDGGLSGFCDGSEHRSWTGLYGAAGVMAGINAGVASTLGGGVVCRSLGWTVERGMGGGLASWRGAWHVIGVTGRTLDGRIDGGALGLQLLATTVSLLLSSLDRMWNGLLLRVWH
jgi:hypothetical protein